MYLGQGIVQEGSRSEDVKTLQVKLAAVGYSPGPIDGLFGPQTLTAVKAFQTARGLNPDGIVGPDTWGALLALTAPLPQLPPIPMKKPAPAPVPMFAGLDWTTWLLYGAGGVLLYGMLMRGRRRAT